MTNLEINDITANLSSIKLNKEFSLDSYFIKTENDIKKVLQKKQHANLTYDILDTANINKIKLITLKEKQRQMKIGEIWQICLGNYDKFINLGINHETGLDILSKERKIIIELKNRTNTDNNSALKTNLTKLAKYKKKNSDYKCIYGCINEMTEIKTLKGDYKKIIHDNAEIEKYTGYKLLNLILGDDLEKILNFIKETIDKYTIDLDL